MKWSSSPCPPPLFASVEVFVLVPSAAVTHSRDDRQISLGPARFALNVLWMWRWETLCFRNIFLCSSGFVQVPLVAVWKKPPYPLSAHSFRVLLLEFRAKSTLILHSDAVSSVALNWSACWFVGLLAVGLWQPLANMRSSIESSANQTIWEKVCVRYDPRYSGRKGDFKAVKSE